MAWVLAWVFLWAAARVGGEDSEAGLCGLNGCQAIDLAKRYTDLTMAKMMHTIKPDAMEEVFESMSRLEALVRQVEDLTRDTGSLLQPGMKVVDEVESWVDGLVFCGGKSELVSEMQICSGFVLVDQVYCEIFKVFVIFVGVLRCFKEVFDSCIYLTL